MAELGTLRVVEAAVAEDGGVTRGRWRLTARRFLRRRGALFGAVVVLLLFVVAFGGPYLTHWSYADIDYSAMRQPPSAEHWWGTNGIGQDVFAQTVRGLQKSLLIGLFVAFFSTGLAGLVGACAGYYRGWVERLSIGVVDLLLVFPSFLIISIVAARLRGAGWIAFVVLLAAFGWMISARVVRTMTISLSGREFIRAARFMGVTPVRIIARHILPNVASFLIIDATIAVGAAVISETSLSYFGFGVQRPDVSLGTLIADGTTGATTYPWMFFFAAGLLVVFVLAVNLIGDGLRDALDPTSDRPPSRRRRVAAVPSATLPTPGTTVPTRPARDVADDEDVVLAVRDLTVTFDTSDGPVRAVRGVGFTLRRGEVLGIVGESGSGKSVTALAVLGLLPGTARATGSVVVRAGGTGRTDVLTTSDRELSRLRGRTVSIVFQDPLSAFTPVHRVGDQIAEALLIHQDLTRSAARARAVELLDAVGIPDPAVRAHAYPHEFSGGMRQRAMIAMAMANRPDIILADEPTTALDVTIQAQILEVLRTAARQTGAALLLVSHDLGVIAGMADRVAVMYAGRVVETADTVELFQRPLMPYTLGLIGAVPRLDRAAGLPLVPIPGSPPGAGDRFAGCPFAARCPMVVDVCRTTEPRLTPPSGTTALHPVACHRSAEIAASGATPLDIYPAPELPDTHPADGPVARRDRPPVLRVQGLTRTFPLRQSGFLGMPVRGRSGSVYAVDGMDLDIRRGESLGLVGESGSGKSTALFELLDLAAPEAGRVELLGRHIDGAIPAAQVLALRAQLQIVFQDPMTSLDPRMPVHDIVAEPLRAQRAPAEQIAHRVPEVLRLVGLQPQHADRFPHEFSGGQRQRIGIARALSVQPSLLVLDEPVSALDVSIQAGVLNLLNRLRADLGLAYLFVSHDLAVIRHIADRVSVVYLGRTIEAGDTEEVFRRPRHPYTQALLSAAPSPDPVQERRRQRILLPGDPPSPTVRHTGCRFRARCRVFAGLSEPQRQRCATEVPALVPATPDTDHVAACHFPPVDTDARLLFGG